MQNTSELVSKNCEIFSKAKTETWLVVAIGAQKKPRLVHSKFKYNIGVGLINALLLRIFKCIINNYTELQLLRILVLSMSQSVVHPLVRTPIRKTVTVKIVSLRLRQSVADFFQIDTNIQLSNGKKQLAKLYVCGTLNVYYKTNSGFSYFVSEPALCLSLNFNTIRAIIVAHV